MTCCLGIVTRHGLAMASDRRTNAGFDQVNICRKMHTFVTPGERVFIVLTSGSLSLTQSVITLCAATSTKDAVWRPRRAVRRGARLRRTGAPCLRPGPRGAGQGRIPFQHQPLVGGQVGREPPNLYLIYPQGNPLAATEDSPYLQIGESKYGRPILDRGVRYDRTTLEEAAKYALISMDSTMRSNVTVGPPIDLLLYRTDELRIRAIAVSRPKTRTCGKFIKIGACAASRGSDLPAIRFEAPAADPEIP